MIAALFLVSSLFAAEQTLSDYQNKKIIFTNSSGFWLEKRCEKEACRSKESFDVSQLPKAVAGHDRVNVFCQEVLQGQIVNLKDAKKNDWGFCRLSDGSLLDKNLLRSKLGEAY